MGFFSWKTQDTDRSIASKWSTNSTFKVDMLDDKGNVWTENNYDGYGVFGGKDYYELLAEMNGVTSDLEGEQYTDFMRIRGIEIAFENNGSGVGTKGVKYPNLFEDSDVLDISTNKVQIVASIKVSFMKMKKTMMKMENGLVIVVVHLNGKMKLEYVTTVENTQTLI
jgi:hypothetical protein